MQSLLEQKRKQLADSLMQFLGFAQSNSEVTTPRELKEFEAGHDMNHDDKQLRINQKLRE